MRSLIACLVVVTVPALGRAQLSTGCVGDCNADGGATVDEVVRLVDIALGERAPSSCPHGIPSRSDVDVALIIRAVIDAVRGCPALGATDCCQCGDFCSATVHGTCGECDRVAGGRCEGGSSCAVGPTPTVRSDATPTVTPPPPPCGGLRSDCADDACSCPIGTSCDLASCELGGCRYTCQLSNECAASQAPSCGGPCFSGHCGQNQSGDGCTCMCDQGACSFVTQLAVGGDAVTYVAVDRDGELFAIVDWSVQKFDNHGSQITSWGSRGSGLGQFENPNGIAVGASGNVFVADSGNGRVQEFDNNGTFVRTWGSGQFGISGPVGIGVDPNGNVFVGDVFNGRIKKFMNTGSLLLEWGGPGSGDGQFADGPLGIAVDQSGNVYATDPGNHRIQKFDNDGRFLLRWVNADTDGDPLDYPWGIAVDANGNVLVSEWLDDLVLKFTNSGALLGRFGCAGTGEGQFDGALGIAADGSGAVFVADDGNARVEKFACPAGG